MISHTIKRELANLLDEAQQLALRGQGIQAITRLCIGLSQIKLQTNTDEFGQEVVSTCHSHPLFELVQQDPYSRRACEKPRGYAGDAVMLDYHVVRTRD